MCKCGMSRSQIYVPTIFALVRPHIHSITARKKKREMRKDDSFFCVCHAARLVNKTRESTLSSFFFFYSGSPVLRSRFPFDEASKEKKLLSL